MCVKYPSYEQYLIFKLISADCARSSTHKDPCNGPHTDMISYARSPRPFA